jgi:calcium permeable stress-gated cation channel
VRNPSKVKTHDPAESVLPSLRILDIERDPEAQPRRLVVPHRPRPMMRAGWLGPMVDTLEYFEMQLKNTDEDVLKTRKMGNFKSTQTTFITSEKMSGAAGDLSS